MILRIMENCLREKLKYLFLCTGNSCRSQMAEAWTRHLKDDVIEAYSAGIETHGLNPDAVKVMAEVGVDMSGHKCQTIEDFNDVRFDVVVTVCDHARENCPLFPGSCKLVHVGFSDPPQMANELAEHGASAQLQLDCYRRVRDEIKTYVETLSAV